jgi:diketogulonate reductase-like aldo/keto reductase
LYEEGIVKNIGVCNVRIGHLKRMEAFQKIKPNYIQIERHPLHTCSTLINFCKDHSIKVQAYSPLCRMIPSIKESPLLNSLKEKYHKKDIGQIILRWHLQTGSIPVFTSRNSNRINSNLDIFDFQLDKIDIDSINRMNNNYKIFLESTGCPGYENW